MSTKTVVQLKNVKKRIGRKTIIDDLSFDVNSGEVFGFLGPNGAGKTTTIRMMLGLISITEGEIFINGHSIKREFEKAISCVGGIVENPDMYKHMTAYQNLVHYARMYKGIGKERINEVIKIVGLEKRINDKIKTYSLGMRQRLGLAQALLNHPSLIVLDEPTNGLDPAGIHELRGYLQKIAHEENVAVMVSSHLLSEMELMCDRVAIIQSGKLVKIQTLNELIEDTEDAANILINAQPKAKAVECLKKLNDGYNPVIKGDEIEISAEWDDIPNIVKKLVENDIQIYEVHKAVASLEDKFLEMTGGNEIA